ncbi:ABC transporter permease [Dactylosporangium sp. CS-033363]|uniref:ABC transporter permease n=1 Tax=Dactylosporangium sp. CS-033363 TaxID=3239935 RepID=UPI003D92C473
MSAGTLTETAAQLDAEIAEVERRIRQRNRRTTRLIWLAQLAIVVVGLALWEVLSRTFGWDFWVSSPSGVWEQLVAWAQTEELWTGLRATLTVTILGFVPGALAGALIGFLFGWFRTLGRIFEPFVLAFYTLPKIALAPLFILWFGIDVLPKVVLAAVLVFFLVFFTTFQGAKTVDRSMLEMGYLMGGGKLAVFRKIVVPTSWVWVFSGFKISLPYALIGAVVGEFMAATEGIGFMIKNATNEFNTAGVFAGLVVLMIVAIILTQALRLVEHKLLHWNDGS